MFKEWMSNRGGHSTGRDWGVFGDEKVQVHLDEKYFRRVDKVDGDPNKYRGWLFELVVALGQIDGQLQRQVESLVKGNVLGEVSVEHWDVVAHVGETSIENIIQNYLDFWFL